MWQGVLQGYMMEMERQERESEREEARRIREEDRAIRQSEFDRTYALNQARMRMELLERYGDTRADTSELVGLGERLSGIIRDPEVVSQIVGTGNTEAVKNLTSQVESYYNSYLEQNPGAAEAASQALTDILANSYEFSGQTEQPVDLSSLEGLLDPEILGGLNLVRMRPGSITGAPIVYTPRATLTDRNQARQEIVSGYQDLVNIEVQNIEGALSGITQALESSDPSVNRDALQADQDLLVARRRMAQEALEGASGDNPTFSPLVSLYGDSFIDSYLGGVPFAMTRQDLGPSFVSPPPRTRMSFVDEAQYRRFGPEGYGLVKPGDIVVIAGEEVVAAE